MSKINKFEDLEVWQVSRKMPGIVYKLTSNHSFNRDRGL